MRGVTGLSLPASISGAFRATDRRIASPVEITCRLAPVSRIMKQRNPRSAIQPASTPPFGRVNTRVSTPAYPCKETFGKRRQHASREALFFGEILAGTASGNVAGTQSDLGSRGFRNGNRVCWPPTGFTSIGPAKFLSRDAQEPVGLAFGG
jgi:hypothetical protein